MTAVFIFLVYAVLIVAMVASVWKIFTKAGKPGWAALVPIYNQIVMLEVVGKPAWWLLLFFIPVVGLVINIIVMVELAKVFGKSGGFVVGLIFLTPIFIMILGLGNSQYVGPGGAGAVPPVQPGASNYTTPPTQL